ncbi:hypothetical protein [Paenibacillus daejeonensis]|uniref:hypothetical protein n=1 Tax=Paenibacillus daejeonensis TaxID=135193 RepID=UPI0003726C2E|nr:hypothetical protein [Paenibacillus daejeonensis]
MSVNRKLKIGGAVAALALGISALVFFNSSKDHCSFDQPCEPSQVTELTDFSLLPNGSFSLATGTDGQIIVIGGEMASSEQRLWNGTISARLFNPDSGQDQPLYELPMDYPAQTAHLSPDGREIALFCYGQAEPARCADERGTGLIATIADGQVVRVLDGPHVTVSELFELPDAYTERSLVIPDSALFVHADRPQGDVVLFSLENGSEQQRYPLTNAEDPPTFVHVVPSPDGRKLAVIHHYEGEKVHGEYLSILDREDGRTLATFRLEQTTWHAAWTENSMHVVTARALSRTGIDKITELSVFDISI